MNKISILLAEDHRLVRESIRQSLERDSDFTVVGEAGDGEQAVRMAAELKPAVVIMDIAMPKLSGIEATRLIKLARPQTIILVLTAYDYEQYIFPVLEAGAAGYLLKDISSQELTNAIKTVFRGEAVLHPAIARKVLARFSRDGKDLTGDSKSDVLSDRENTIIKLAAKGMSNNEIAEELHLSVRTIESHLGSIFNKMGVGSRIEAVITAMKKGWFTLEELS